MSEPRRLLDGPCDPDERQLLLRGRDERAPERAAFRTLAAVGLAGSLVATAGSAKAASASSKLAGMLKWFAIGAGGTVMGAAAGEVMDRPPPAEVSISAERVASERRTGASGSTPIAEVPAASSAVPKGRTAAQARVAASAPASRSRGPSANEPRRAPGSIAPDENPAPAEDGLGREIALVDDARRSLGAHDANAALAHLDRYQRHFPRGGLRPEAMLLRIEALIALGRRAEAEELARPLLERLPRGAQRDRLERMLARK